MHDYTDKVNDNKLDADLLIIYSDQPQLYNDKANNKD